MEKANVEGFRDILRRIHSEKNYDRYTAICTQARDEDEERIWRLCEKFWPCAYSDRDVSIEEYVANNFLDDRTARKYLKELSDLLDKLGWD